MGRWIRGSLRNKLLARRQIHRRNWAIHWRRGRSWLRTLWTLHRLHLTISLVCTVDWWADLQNFQFRQRHYQHRQSGKSDGASGLEWTKTSSLAPSLSCRIPASHRPAPPTTLRRRASSDQCSSYRFNKKKNRRGPVRSVDWFSAEILSIIFEMWLNFHRNSKL